MFENSLKSKDNFNKFLSNRVLKIIFFWELIILWEWFKTIKLFLLLMENILAIIDCIEVVSFIAELNLQILLIVEFLIFIIFNLSFILSIIIVLSHVITIYIIMNIRLKVSLGISLLIFEKYLLMLLSKNNFASYWLISTKFVV